jgi:MoxR-like ATPase
MSMISLEVGSKQVGVSLPYRPAEGDGDELVGREAECRAALAAWLPQPGFPPMAPILVGEPGVGKNRIVYELARLSGKELYVLQGHEDITAEDLACTVRFSDDPARKMDYLLSPLATAMLKGGIAFIDEIGKLRPRALAPLSSVLDDRRYLDSTLLGERIHAHPGFRLIAATNAVDLEGEGMPDFVQSRLRPRIDVGYPNREMVKRIVQRRFPRLSREDGLVRRFWKLWDQHRGDALPSPRDTLYVFGMAINLADYEAGRRTDADASPALEAYLEEAFRRMLPERREP